MQCFLVFSGKQTEVCRSGFYIWLLCFLLFLYEKANQVTSLTRWSIKVWPLWISELSHVSLFSYLHAAKLKASHSRADSSFQRVNTSLHHVIIPIKPPKGKARPINPLHYRSHRLFVPRGKRDTGNRIRECQRSGWGGGGVMCCWVMMQQKAEKENSMKKNEKTQFVTPL